MTDISIIVSGADQPMAHYVIDAKTGGITNASLGLIDRQEAEEAAAGAPFDIGPFTIKFAAKDGLPDHAAKNAVFVPGPWSIKTADGPGVDQAIQEEFCSGSVRQDIEFCGPGCACETAYGEAMSYQDVDEDYLTIEQAMEIDAERQRDETVAAVQALSDVLAPMARASEILAAMISDYIVRA